MRNMCLKKIWNRVDCQRSEKRSQNTQEIKRTLFNRTEQDKTCVQDKMYVARKRWLHRKFARFVLFRLIKKRSFNLLCVLDLFFSECWQSTVSDLKNLKNLIWKIWNRVDCQRSEKRSQNTQEIKRTLFNWTKLDKTCTFSRKSSFSSYVQHKNWKTNNEFNLSCVSWMWKAGRRKRARGCLLRLKIGWINCFSVFMLYVAWKRGLSRKCSRFVQFRPIKKRSFDLCVLEVILS